MRISNKLILWGLCLALTGWLIIFLIVIGVIPSSIALSFFAYFIFFLGFSMGMLALHTQVHLNRLEKAHKDLMEEQWEFDENEDGSDDEFN